MVPDEVWHETVDAQRVSQSQLVRVDSIQRISLSSVEVTEFVRQQDLTHLQKGEQECLFCCHEQGIQTLLTDDLAVRTAAKHQRITPVGSLGIVVRMFHNQLVTLTEAEMLLFRLYDESSLFVTRAIIELAIEQLHKKGR